MASIISEDELRPFRNLMASITSEEDLCAIYLQQPYYRHAWASIIKDRLFETPEPFSIEEEEPEFYESRKVEQ